MDVRLSEWKNDLILSENDKQHTYWMLDDTHFSRPLTPLFASFMLPAVTAGTKRAFENMKLPIVQFITKSDHGYYYQSAPAHPEPFEERMARHKEKMSAFYPRIKSYMEGIVSESLMPFYRKLMDRSTRVLSRQEALQYVQELESFYTKAWQHHFEITFSRMSLLIELEALYGQVTGEPHTKKVFELMQGTMNMSLETDRGLWLLAEQVKSSELLRSALQESGDLLDRLHDTAEGREFVKELRDFLSIYGHRTALTHEFTDETWYENPSYALSIIMNYVDKDYDFDKEFKQAVADRTARAEVWLNSLPQGEMTNRLIEVYHWALDCWGVDEDHHFYIDAMIAAKSRYFLKNVGRTLVQEQVLATEEDIFYLYLDDLLEALREPRALHEVVKHHKCEHYEYRKRRPEPFFGTPPKLPPDPMIERIFGVLQEAIQEPTMTLRGYAASAGTYRGKVKVIWGQEDFAKLTTGDILVCRTLTPPWTVLFPIAGALITDAGGILSHASIVAREYRLPAVVGTKRATSCLQDGDEVTVDGTVGVVHMHAAESRGFGPG